MPLLHKFFPSLFGVLVPRINLERPVVFIEQDPATAALTFPAAKLNAQIVLPVPCVFFIATDKPPLTAGFSDSSTCHIFQLRR